MSYLTQAHLICARRDYGFLAVLWFLISDAPLHRLQDFLGNLSISPGWLWALDLQMAVIRIRGVRNSFN